MRLRVNGEEQDLDEGLTLGALLGRLGVRTDAVAVALNLEVVPRSKLPDIVLREGDRVEIVRAVGGG